MTRRMRDKRMAMRDYRRRSNTTGRYMPDSARSRDYGYEPDFNTRMGDHYQMGMRDYTRGMRDYRGGRDYTNNMNDYRRDYGEPEYLDDEELMEWSKDLLMQVPETHKAFFSKENIERKAKEMGVKFNEYTFPEFYTTALMKFTDHSKTLGTANMDIYLRMAVEFLEDEDAELRGSEKLAVYYDKIVCGE